MKSKILGSENFPKFLNFTLSIFTLFLVIFISVFILSKPMQKPEISAQNDKNLTTKPKISNTENFKDFQYLKFHYENLDQNFSKFRTFNDFSHYEILQNLAEQNLQIFQNFSFQTEKKIDPKMKNYNFSSDFNPQISQNFSQILGTYGGVLLPNQNLAKFDSENFDENLIGLKFGAKLGTKFELNNQNFELSINADYTEFHNFLEQSKEQEKNLGIFFGYDYKF